MARIEAYETAAQLRDIITASLHNGECVVVSNVGVLVGSKVEAIMTFRQVASARRREGDFDIFEVTDSEGVDAIAFDMSRTSACWLYGVSPNDLAIELADFSTGMMQ